jgi:large subunit ribosomal protein L25
MKSVTLNATSRNNCGSRKSRQLRRDGFIPAVMYGRDGNQSLAVSTAEFKKLWKQVLGTTAIIEVSIDGKKSHTSLIQEVQRNSRNDEFLHIDFHEVSAQEKIHTPISVHIHGESIGVKQENGTLDVNLHEVEVRCLPKDLPSFIDLDVSELHAGQAIHIKDLPAIPGVEFLGDPDLVVVSCLAAKGATEDAAAAPETPAS